MEHEIKTLENHVDFARFVQGCGYPSTLCVTAGLVILRYPREGKDDSN